MDYLILFLLAINIVLLILLLLRSRHRDDHRAQLAALMDETRQSFDRIEKNFREDFALNREENRTVARENRDELSRTLRHFGESFDRAVELLQTLQREHAAAMATAQQSQTERMEKALETIRSTVDEKLQVTLNERLAQSFQQIGKELAQSLNQFREASTQSMEAFGRLQHEKFTAMDERQRRLLENTEKGLEQIRQTVDEKLQKTLNERLGQSFQLVSQQLESVQKGLGEMQTLAQDVGSLKRVLSNVKTRGNIGEIQLEMLLEQILAPEQYEANVKTVPTGSDFVEFAVKLPGKDDVNDFVYLPIDAKFPKDVYEQLADAYESGNLEEIETCSRQLETSIRKMAKDIADKYLNPPVTTDFAIMFLPFESIYAEVIRRSALLEELQRTYRVVVTGPTTLAAILNSLQMGFRTLAIQKHSGRVWSILGEVKKEFEKFGGMLEKAQKNLQTASGQLDEVLGTRTRAIQRKLRDVDTLNELDGPTPSAQLFKGE